MEGRFLLIDDYKKVAVRAKVSGEEVDCVGACVGLGESQGQGRKDRVVAGFRDDVDKSFFMFESQFGAI